MKVETEENFIFMAPFILQCFYTYYAILPILFSIEMHCICNGSSNLNQNVLTKVELLTQ